MKAFNVIILPFLALTLTYTLTVHASGNSGEDYSAGEELYDLGCANCHGKNMLNPGTSSFNLREFPKDQKRRFIESVSNGKGFMPALGDVFDAEEIEQLWIYISRHEKQQE